MLLLSYIFILNFVLVVKSVDEYAPETPCGYKGEGWTLYNESCYIYNNKEFTFSTGDSYCRGFLGGEANLVSIQNKNENDFIRQSFAPQNRHIWIGLKLDTRDRFFKWINGDSGQYRNWLYGGKTPRNTNEMCGIMMETGQWINSNCNTLLPVVCKKAAIYIKENKKEKIIIKTVLPAVIVIFMVIFVMIMINQSKNEVNLLRGRQNKNEPLHLVLTHKNPIQKLKHVKYMPPPTMMSLKNSNVDDISISPHLKKSTDSEAWESILNNASFRKKKNTNKENTPTVIRLLSPVDIKPIKRNKAQMKSSEKKGKVFYVHDEVVANRHTGSSSMEPQIRRKSTIDDHNDVDIHSNRLDVLRRSSLSESSVSSYADSNKHLELDDNIVENQSNVIENKFSTKLNDENFVEITLF